MIVNPEERYAIMSHIQAARKMIGIAEQLTRTPSDLEGARTQLGEAERQIGMARDKMTARIEAEKARAKSGADANAN